MNHKTFSTKNIGTAGELSAENYIRQLGWVILENNYHSRFGEIDIIAKDKDEIVFIEVKTRQNTIYGLPHESITRQKLNRIQKTALLYLLKHHMEQHYYRFDVISISSCIGKNQQIEHMKHVF